MFDHVTLGAADRAASRAVLRDRARSTRPPPAVAPYAGFRPVEAQPALVRYSAGERRGSFTVLEGEPTTPFHLAFPAPDPAVVADFHRALTGAGHSDHGGPGERPEYHPGYVGACVLDPDGHNAELVHHGRRH